MAKLMVEKWAVQLGKSTVVDLAIATVVSMAALKVALKGVAKAVG